MKKTNYKHAALFFEDTKDAAQNSHNKELFSGFSIERAGEAYTQEMNQYLVIMITLKSTKRRNYEDAMACLRKALAEEYARHEKQVQGMLKNHTDWERYMEIRE